MSLNQARSRAGTAEDAAPAALNRWLILAVICLPVFIGSVDLTIVSAFLPDLIAELGLPPQSGLDDAAWIVTAYLLADTIGLIFMGRFSDLAGRRITYFICMMLFVAGSVLVAIAHTWPTDLLYSLLRRAGQRPDPAYVTLQVIIIGRVIQALGAGALQMVTLALVSDLFPPRQRARPLGVVGAVDTLGWVLGHLYGGVMVYWFNTQGGAFENLFRSLGLNWGAPDWRALFWINVPIALGSLAVLAWALRKTPMHRAQGRFDLLGAGLITGALVALTLGLGANIEIDMSATDFEDLSTVPPYGVPLLVLAAGLFALFVLAQTHALDRALAFLRRSAVTRWLHRALNPPDPLVSPRLFARRPVWSGALTNLIVGYCLFIGLVSVPILINVRAGLSETLTLEDAALQVGFLLSALTVPMALAIVPGGWLSERLGYSAVTAAGLVIAAVGFLLIWQTWTFEIETLAVALEMAIVGVGIGLTFAPISAAVINAADEGERGVAASLIMILRLIGMTMSVSSLTTFAVQRVNALAAAALSQLEIDTQLYLETYARHTVQVLGELGLIGAALCLLAIAPALMLGRLTRAPDHHAG
jgi:MFS family permease